MKTVARIPLSSWFLLSLVVLVSFGGGSAIARPLVDGWENGLTGCPLSVSDQYFYRRMIALQDAGAWQAAQRMRRWIDDDLLIGWVTARQLLGENRVFGHDALSAWLERHADHPDAERIHALATRRKPADAAALAEPIRGERILANQPPLFPIHFYRSDKTLSHAAYRRLQQLKRQIGAKLDAYKLVEAERILNSDEVARLFDDYELDQVRAGLAAGWFYRGDSDKAFELASAVAEREGARLPLAHWTAGLAAWRLNDIAAAAGHFAQLSEAAKASPWNRAAGGYWAARAYFRLGDTANANKRLRVASRYPRTFYGLLATRRLGESAAVTLAFGPRECQRFDALKRSGHGARAMALLQLGQAREAIRELELVADWNRRPVAEALLALGRQAGLYNFSMNLAQRLVLQPEGGWSHAELDPYLYPLPPLRPPEGFVVDRALVFAFMRQESGFDPEAGSEDGALGLMQLLPNTAASMHEQFAFKGEQRDLLHDPVLNISLGQRYLRWLMKSQRVGDNLLRLAAAYNAGPGTLGKWDKRMETEDDPLLFVESLPALETRLFIERVFANLWVYRLGLGQPVPSLDALVLDLWPNYQALDGDYDVRNRLTVTEGVAQSGLGLARGVP